MRLSLFLYCDSLVWLLSIRSRVSLHTQQHLEGGQEAGEGSSSSNDTVAPRAVELFLLTDMLSGGKRGMPLLRSQAALVIVRRFHQLPAVASSDAEEEEEDDEGGEDGGKTIGREEVLRAALECLMDL